MAKSGDIIVHPVTGEKLIFRQTAQETAGALLQGELIVQPHGFVAAEHIHPMQEEHFEVLEGSITFRINGIESELHKGQTATVPAGTPHLWWNASDEEAHVLVDLRPALRSEDFFETFFGLAQDGKVDQKTGLPNPLVLALIMREFRNEICLAKPPVAVQRVLFGVLGSVGRMRGYQGIYPYPY